MSLLDLPAEVRTRVYSYVFGYGLAEAISCSNDHGTVMGYYPDERSAQLLRVSKAISTETAAVFLNQTIVYMARNVAIFEYLTDCCIHVLGPTLEGIRHLKIDFHSNDLQDIEVQHIYNIDLPNIKDIRMTCFALHWADTYPAEFLVDTRYSYENSVVWLRGLAMMFLATTNLCTLEEKSIIWKKVVIELCASKAEPSDAKVSHHSQHLYPD